MIYRRLIAAVLPIVLGASYAAMAQTTSTASTRQYTFPPVGLGSTETAEVNVVNLAANASTGAAASCAGTIAFLNATGATIGTATSFTVSAGQGFSARLPFTSTGGTSPRTVIRPVITQNISTATPRPPCSLAYTFEVYETSSGATHAVVTGAAASGGPGGHF